MTSPAAAPETPLTDAQLRGTGPLDVTFSGDTQLLGDGTMKGVVSADFARTLETSLASLRQEVGRLEEKNKTLLANRDALAHGEKVALELMATAEARVRELEGQWNDARDIAGKGPNVLVARELIKEWTDKINAADARVQELEQTDDITMTAFEALSKKAEVIHQQFLDAIKQRDAAISAIAAAEADKLEFRKLLGGFAVDAMQQDFDEINNWAMSAKVDFKTGAPILIDTAAAKQGA